MQIQINTDRNIEGHEALAAHVTEVVKSTLHRVSDHITRVEVHLSDKNGGKSSKDDKRCVMEARIEGRAPLAVTEHAESVHQAVDGAVQKLIRSIESNLGRLHDQQRRTADAQLATPAPDA
ncbi:MAG: ribosomal subunit interface protein [Rhodoferax sp.]|jgi:ribosomal subunit interface protein